MTARLAESVAVASNDALSLPTPLMAVSDAAGTPQTIDSGARSLVPPTSAVVSSQTADATSPDQHIVHNRPLMPEVDSGQIAVSDPGSGPPQNIVDTRSPARPPFAAERRGYVYETVLKTVNERWVMFPLKTAAAGILSILRTVDRFSDAQSRWYRTVNKPACFVK